MSFYIVPLEEAQKLYPDYTFIKALTPSAQRAAFHVRDEKGIDLCLKIIHDNDDDERLRREIGALYDMNHKNLAKLIIYENSVRYGVQRHYLVEHFIDGCDFTETLSKAPLSLDNIIHIFSQLCDGLSVLNDKGIVHRDLKPSNIRINKNNDPVIIDFGVARHLRLPDLTSTQRGADIGTPLYFAPEQTRGNRREIEHRTDLFALGIILYEAAVGTHPFADIPGDLYQNIQLSTAYLMNPDYINLPPLLKIIIKKLLEKERINRPMNAGQVKLLLQKLGGS
ncbi:serine/threonine protein kinase [Herpetosiphon giganteus]|uniref:serine/threonine protein kinase n=1 Tax=Herpetosiphon giganteus TaxID=2029754 RepID=UPI00195A43E2|nr:serine/threonine-protein kinase [Herpetosiphon giganteus]MBM7845371.1 serine/threonine-protein kinase [Herpetosiphon giganteus]